MTLISGIGRELSTDYLYEAASCATCLSMQTSDAAIDDGYAFEPVFRVGCSVAETDT